MSEFTVLSLNSVSAHKAGCRNLERSFERAVDIGLDFFLVNDLAVMVLQIDGEFFALQDSALVILLSVIYAFYIYSLPRPVDRPVGQ